jgi:hypothetical protein
MDHLKPRSSWKVFASSTTHSLCSSPTDSNQTSIHGGYATAAGRKAPRRVSLTTSNGAQSFRGWHPVAVNGAFGNIAGLVLRPRHEHLVRQVQRRSHHDVQQRNHKRPQQACRHFSGRIYPQLIQVHIRGLQQEPFVIGAEHPREPEERRYEVRVLQPHTREVALPSCLTQLALRKSKPPSTDLFCTAISLSEVFAPVPPLARLCRFTCRSAQLGR